jgi:hypothetical protein
MLLEGTLLANVAVCVINITGRNIEKSIAIGLARFEVAKADAAC